VTWEPRGLGRSQLADPPARAAMADVWAEDLEAFCSELVIDSACLWAQGFASYYAIRFAARWPARVDALVTYTDIWAQAPGKSYAEIWNVYRAIVENFGVTPFGARVLAHIFDVPSPAWFYEWEQENILDTVHEETLATTIGYCLTEADVRGDLSALSMPVLVLQGDSNWNGQLATDDVSLRIMEERIPHLETVVIADAHPGYVLIQKPIDCVTAVTDFFARSLARRSGA
jgi:pimeloyl-ACP methyl ester carboxylesterase